MSERQEVERLAAQVDHRAPIVESIAPRAQAKAIDAHRDAQRQRHLVVLGHRRHGQAGTRVRLKNQ
jgi:hypothetical protein